MEEVERGSPDAEAVTVEEMGRLLETGSVRFIVATSHRTQPIK